MYLIFSMLLTKSLIFFSWVIMLSSALAYSSTAYCIYFFSIFSFFFIINMRPSLFLLLMTFNAQFTCCISVKTVSSFRVLIRSEYFSSNVHSLCSQGYLSVFIMKFQVIYQVIYLMFCICVNNYCQQSLLSAFNQAVRCKSKGYLFKYHKHKEVNF